MTMCIRAIVTLLGIAFGLVACGQPQTAKPPQAARYSWLDESACRPPCWEGITPGVTTVTATADLLKANPTIQHVRVTDLAYVNHDGEHEIRWGWTPPSPSTRGGYAFALNGSFMIDHVGLFLDTPVAFASVQERLGPPSHALLTVINDPHSNDATWKLDFIYFDQGMILSAISPTPLPLNTVTIGQVLFTHADEAHVLSQLPSAVLYPWQEGAALPTYCNEGVNYERCRLFQ